MFDTKPHVLFVLTSHSRGWYLPELAHPYEVLAPSCRVSIASHNGGEAPIDQSSIESYKNDDMCANFLKKESLWKDTAKLDDFATQINDIDCIFFVGGYGPMMDLVDSQVSSDIVSKLYAQNKIISGICHGPAVFARVKDPADSSKYLLDGHRVTAVSNLECDTLYPINGLKDPWSVEDAITKATNGGYEKADKPFTEKVVISKNKDGKVIITGQQPASGIAVGKALYQELFGKAYAG